MGEYTSSPGSHAIQWLLLLLITIYYILDDVERLTVDSVSEISHEHTYIRKML